MAAPAATKAPVGDEARRAVLPVTGLACHRPRRSQAALWLRRMHALAGVIFTLNFLLLLLTGVLIQHREDLRLEEQTISRRYLPSGYRPQDPDPAIRADIVVSDLHSGRLFGRAGVLVVDISALGFLAMVASGLVVFVWSKLRKENGNGFWNNGAR